LSFTLVMVTKNTALLHRPWGSQMVTLKLLRPTIELSGYWPIGENRMLPVALVPICHLPAGVMTAV